MTQDKMKVLYFDIETSPSMAWVWSTGKQYVGHEQILEPTRIICVSCKYEGEKKVHNFAWDNKQQDKKLLTDFRKFAEEADIIVGHNGKNFDLKHLNARIAFHRLPPLNVTMIEDTLALSRRKFRIASHSLAYLAKYFGVGAKGETGGISLWLDVWLRNDRKALKKMLKYCDQDVILLEQVLDRLRPYLDVKANKSTFALDDRICPSCGGDLKLHDKRFTSAMRRVQRYRCKKCLKVFTDGRNLLKGPSHYPR